MSMRRIERLERAAAAEANGDWRLHPDDLPKGVTVAAAERVLRLWAILSADYASEHDVSIPEAFEATRDTVLALLKGDTLPEEDDDDDE